MQTEKQKEFIKELEKISLRYDMRDVFTDTVRMMALSLYSPVALHKKAVEDEFSDLRRKYNDGEYEGMQKLFAITIEALEERREDFLGGVLEGINGTNAHNGQFFTPASVAKLMSKVVSEPLEYTPGEVISLCDPACGASVLMIEEAEELIQGDKKVAQGDVYIEVGDVDSRACDISFVQLSLLGYAAKVEHMDALAMKRFSEPRYTIGYFAHGMPIKLWRKRNNLNVRESGESGERENAGAQENEKAEQLMLEI